MSDCRKETFPLKCEADDVECLHQRFGQVIAAVTGHGSIPAAEPSHSSMDTSCLPHQHAARESSLARLGCSQPTLHVEVCQRPHSAMAGTKLKELVVELLLERGTVFSELLIVEFEHPILKEHLLSVSITDTPAHLKVIYTLPDNYSINLHPLLLLAPISTSHCANTYLISFNLHLLAFHVNCNLHLLALHINFNFRLPADNLHLLALHGKFNCHLP